MYYCMYWLSFVTRPLTLMLMGERMTWKKFYVVEWGRSDWFYWGRKWLGREWHSKIWLMKKIWKSIYLVFLELRCFSSMLPSMPKGEIVSMNVDAMGEYSRTLILTVFVIDDNIVTCNKVADCDCLIEDDRLIILWLIVRDIYYDMSWSCSSVCIT